MERSGKVFDELIKHYIKKDYENDDQNIKIELNKNNFSRQKTINPEIALKRINSMIESQNFKRSQTLNISQTISKDKNTGIELQNLQSSNNLNIVAVIHYL